MFLFLLTGQAPLIMVVALGILCYLTAYELWHEEMPFLYKAWWVLFVLLLHVLGFAIFWVFIRLRRRRAARP